MYFISRTILPIISKSLSFYLIGFWKLWLFNYPLNFTLILPTLNLMDWHGTKGIPSLDVLWAYVSNLNSIRWGNPKLLVCHYRVPKLGINGGEGKWPKMFPNVLNQLSSDSWVSLRLTYSIWTPNFDPMSLIFTIYLWREWEDPRSESFTWYFREKRGFSLCFSRFSIPSKFFEWDNFSKYETQTSHLFFNSKNFSTKLQNFSFIELHETNSFTPDCKNAFSFESHEILLRIDWNMFLHDLVWKSHHMKPSSFFQFLVEFSPPTHDFGCYLCLSSLWV